MLAGGRRRPLASVVHAFVVVSDPARDRIPAGEVLHCQIPIGLLVSVPWARHELLDGPPRRLGDLPEIGKPWGPPPRLERNHVRVVPPDRGPELANAQACMLPSLPHPVRQQDTEGVFAGRVGRLPLSAGTHGVCPEPDRHHDELLGPTSSPWPAVPMDHHFAVSVRLDHRLSRGLPTCGCNDERRHLTTSPKPHCLLGDVRA